MPAIIILVIGAAILWWSIKKKNPVAAIVGIIVLLAALATWLPNLFPALAVLVGDFGDALAKFVENAGRR